MQNGCNSIESPAKKKNPNIKSITFVPLNFNQISATQFDTLSQLHL